MCSVAYYGDMADQLPNSVDQLTGAEYNPRVITELEFESLKKSLQTYGDLSGIIKNRHTGNLVGGHQRVEAFRRLGGTITITEQYDKPNAQGTVAIGYITVTGSSERFAYREVNWPLASEQTANIAANKMGGRFDTDALAEVLYGLNEDQRLATGQTQDEVDRLLGQVSHVEVEEPEAHEAPYYGVCPHCGQELKKPLPVDA